MLKSASKKLLTVGIIASSLVFSSQAAFAQTTISETTNYNDDYYVAQPIPAYGDIAKGTISSPIDKDWYSIQTGPNDGGRTMTVFLQNPTDSHYIIIVNKNDASPVNVTYLNPGNNNDWVMFTTEANTRYNFGVIRSTNSNFDPNAHYYLTPNIF
ncbi:hypothetical protein LOZ80_05310 [Paenibacillus sp. HWE-109]|uniref:hypothetical protein n=1 Tax=Paenibacillus sp. HWE-109 TaxID=1306526 RepID=UPI001EE07C61|nr:hypothetical protein [Paenibacillus sp. HWE-109]UKS28358.1 hypothetical protein LOZ80_05310 [Paenibacillus sp. HWE-109]